MAEHCTEVISTNSSLHNELSTQYNVQLRTYVIDLSS